MNSVQVVAARPPLALTRVGTLGGSEGPPPQAPSPAFPLSPGHAIFKLTYLSNHDYKHLYFESDSATVNEIMLKVSVLLGPVQGEQGGRLLDQTSPHTAADRALGGLRRGGAPTVSAAPQTTPWVSCPGPSSTQAGPPSTSSWPPRNPDSLCIIPLGFVFFPSIRCQEPPEAPGTDSEEVIVA